MIGPNEQNLYGLYFEPNNSLINKINEQQTLADITRIKHGSLTRHYTILAEAFHSCCALVNGHRAKSFKNCQEEVCVSNREVLDKVGQL